MNRIKNRICTEVDKSREKYDYYSTCPDLVMFTVGSEYFLQDNDEECDSDFTAICVVDRNWLLSTIRKDYQITDPRHYLASEYTYDDSIEWYKKAIDTNHIAMVNFEPSFD